jgi:hypothetical protein
MRIPRRRLPTLTRRQWVRVIVLGASAVFSVLLWRLSLALPVSRADVVWQVDLGSFTALLTALTIVFAVTVTPQTRWPSFGDLVGAIAVTSWLVIAAAGILCAAASDMWSNQRWLVVGMVLTLVQLALGLDTLVALMRFRSATGRRMLLMRLTTRRLHRAAARGGRVRAAEHPDLADLREEIEYSIDRNDVAEIAARVNEVVEGWPDDVTADQIRYRLALQTHLLERLGRSVLFESLAGDAARAAMPPLVQGALHASWRLTELTFPSRRAPQRDEIPAAVVLGQICRVIGWLQQCAHERLQRIPDDPASRQIINAVAQSRRRIVQFVDPDPPGLFRTSQDPWPYGLSDPTATLLWLAAMTEFGGSHVGGGLYILCEVLTAEKFYGNYWTGDCVFSEIGRRLRADAAPAQTSRAALASCGGLPAVSLELAAGVIAGLRDRRFAPPDGWENDPIYSLDRRYLRSQLTMFATYDCLPGADAALDWMAAALLSAPTQPSLDTVVRSAFAQYCEPSVIPLRSPSERPAAVVLAALSRLWLNLPRQATALTRRLPAPLLAGALQHARFALSADGDGEPQALTWSQDAQRRLGSRRRQERQLLSILEEVLADD